MKLSSIYYPKCGNKNVEMKMKLSSIYYPKCGTAFNLNLTIRNSNHF